MNSGGEPLDLIPLLRSLREDGQTYVGFDCNSRSIVNALDYRIFDGYKVKKHQIQLASEQHVKLYALID
jgi:chaperonin GroEL (HSP60 family)